MDASNGGFDIGNVAAELAKRKALITGIQSMFGNLGGNSGIDSNILSAVFGGASQSPDYRNLINQLVGNQLDLARGGPQGRMNPGAGVAGNNAQANNLMAIDALKRMRGL